MRSIASIILVLSLASAVIVVGVLSTVQNVRDTYLPGIFIAGKLYQAFTPTSVRDGLVGIHRAKWQWFVHAPVATFVLTFSLLALWRLRLKGRRSWLLVGLTCLLLAPGFYIAGWLGVRTTLDPARYGNWLAVILLGVLYALTACAFFAFVQMLDRKRAKSAKAG